MSSANRSRNSRPTRPPRCDRREEEQQNCAGWEQVVLVSPDGQRTHACPAHGARLFLAHPAWYFGAETRPRAIAAVMRQAFGGSR